MEIRSPSGCIGGSSGEPHENIVGCDFFQENFLAGRKLLLCIDTARFTAAETIHNTAYPIASKGRKHYPWWFWSRRNETKIEFEVDFGLGVLLQVKQVAMTTIALFD